MITNPATFHSAFGGLGTIFTRMGSFSLLSFSMAMGKLIISGSKVTYSLLLGMRFYRYLTKLFWYYYPQLLLESLEVFPCYSSNNISLMSLIIPFWYHTLPFKCRCSPKFQHSLTLPWYLSRALHMWSQTTTQYLTVSLKLYWTDHSWILN